MLEYIFLFTLIGVIAGVIIFVWYKIKTQSKSTDVIDDKINDIENILVILISFIEKDGKILYSRYFTPTQFETEFLHGLIQSINMMASSFGGKAKLKKLEYDKKMLLLHDGKLVRGIILCKDNPSSYLENSLTIIVKGFENRYLEELQAYDESHLIKFKKTDKIIEQVFDKPLIDAMTVLWKNTDETEELLSKDETQILSLAIKLLDQHEFFTLPILVKYIHKKIKKSMKESLKIIENLRNRKFIVNYTHVDI